MKIISCINRKDIDSIVIILQRKQKKISSILTNILKECTHFENQNRMNFRNEGERIQKIFQLLMAIIFC